MYQAVGVSTGGKKTVDRDTRDRKGQKNKGEREKEAVVVFLLPSCLSLPRASYILL